MQNKFNRLFDGAATRDMDLEGVKAPAVARSPRPPRRRQQHIVAAPFNVRCRECGADIDALHVRDLVVYCGACCPVCGGTGPERA